MRYIDKIYPGARSIIRICEPFGCDDGYRLRLRIMCLNVGFGGDVGDRIFLGGRLANFEAKTQWRTPKSVADRVEFAFGSLCRGRKTISGDIRI